MCKPIPHQILSMRGVVVVAGIWSWVRADIEWLPQNMLLSSLRITASEDGDNVCLFLMVNISSDSAQWTGLFIFTVFIHGVLQ